MNITSARGDEPNRKNGKGSKTIKTGSGSFELNVSRDRAGTFAPQLIKKNQTQLTPDIDRKILPLFSHGMRYWDMKPPIHNMVGIVLSTGMMTAITDQVITALKVWQHRPLDRMYPIIWMDAIH